jgi:uncharacterized membrane protein YhiD involved in acid resistance
MLEQHLTPRTALWAHIAAGVFVGTVAANAVSWGATVWAARIAAHEAAETMSRAAAARLEQAAQEQRDNAKRRDDRRALEADEAERRKRSLEEQNAERERREVMWARFYRKPPGCDEARGGQWSVDCANDYIRARSRFNDLYDAGKL